jgi:hypothetical protein
MRRDAVVDLRLCLASAVRRAGPPRLGPDDTLHCPDCRVLVSADEHGEAGEAGDGIETSPDQSGQYGDEIN